MSEYKAAIEGTEQLQLIPETEYRTSEFLFDIASSLDMPLNQEFNHSPPYITVHYDTAVTYNLVEPGSMLFLNNQDGDINAWDTSGESDRAIPLPFRRCEGETRFWAKSVKEEHTEKKKFEGFAYFCGGTAIGGTIDLLHVTANWDDLEAGSKLIPVESVTKIEQHNNRERDFLLDSYTNKIRDYHVPLLVKEGKVVLDRLPTDDEYMGFIEEFSKLPKQTVYLRKSDAESTEVV